MSAPQEIVTHYQTNGYHPRSSKHGETLCMLLLKDLIDSCTAFRELAEQGKIVYKLNFVINGDSPTRWNLDLVVGPPASRLFFSQRTIIAQGEPEEIWLAVDAKSIMTEHGKARRNRQRDLNSLHDILHGKNPGTVVGGLVVLNISKKFLSPLRSDITEHKNIERIAQETVELLRGIPKSTTEQKGKGLDALGIIVVDHTNVKGETTKLVSGSPAPASDDPLHYDNFLRDLCRGFTERFGHKS